MEIKQIKEAVANVLQVPTSAIVVKKNKGYYVAEIANKFKYDREAGDYSDKYSKNTILNNNLGGKDYVNAFTFHAKKIESQLNMTVEFYGKDTFKILF